MTKKKYILLIIVTSILFGCEDISLALEDSLTEGSGGNCPSGFILVPQNSSYTSSDFCVAKYEMKDDGGGNAVSQAADSPWGLTRPNAITACQSMGAGYDLISNAQWQTIARNIELVASNWTGASVGSGCLISGNDGGTSCGYDGSNPEFGTSRNARAKHTLSNGEEIFDFAGNVWEWVKDDNPTNYGTNTHLSQITAASHTTTGVLDDGVSRSAKAQFGPAGDYTASSSAPYAGLGYGYVAGGAVTGVLRGGWFSDPPFSATNQAGVFAVNMQNAPNTTGANFGFRCVFEP